MNKGTLGEIAEVLYVKPSIIFWGDLKTMKNLAEIYLNQSPQKFNNELDEFIRNTNHIPEELLIKFDEAYDYDAATPINWLISKLLILNKEF